MFSKQFLAETAAIASQIDCEKIEHMVKELVALRERRGRLFVIGLGGSAANASHMVNDLRKLCEVEAYAPIDNIAEFTAWANDCGWEQVFSQWLSFCKPVPEDAILILSVGGGTEKVSIPITHVVNCCDMWGVPILGIVGRDGGHTAKYADCCLIIPPLYPDRVTPHTEAFQAVVWHCLVSHPDLQRRKTKW